MFRTIKQIFLVCLLISIFGSTAAYPQQRSRSVAKNDIEIELKIESGNPSICFKSNLALRVSIINKSKKRFAFNLDNLWKEVALAEIRPFPEPTHNISIRYDKSTHQPDAMLILAPNESNTVRKEIKITGDAEGKSGKYRLFVAYTQNLNKEWKDVKLWKGRIESDSIEVEMKKCQ